MFKHDKLNLFLFIVLVGLQVLGFVALCTEFEWIYLPIMLAVYFWAGISTTLYLHRYLTHRGFEMPGWLKFFFATGSAVALSGDPVTWVGDHRYHHLKSDTNEDIHSPVHGFPYAHMMWLVRKPPGFRDRSMRYAADVRKIWYCRLWERPYLYVLPHLSVAALLYFTVGGVGLLWCLYVPMLVVYNFTWAVNSICHMPSLGYRSFETTDHSKNNFWIGLGAFSPATSSGRWKNAGSPGMSFGQSRKKSPLTLSPKIRPGRCFCLARRFAIRVSMPKKRNVSNRD
jgi:sn-1 stearoyl-lipid 9-desaturase